jgi:hypothetical protein
MPAFVQQAKEKLQTNIFRANVICSKVQAPKYQPSLIVGGKHRDKPRVCTPAKMFPHLKLIYFIISVYGPQSYF